MASAVLPNSFASLRDREIVPAACMAGQTTKDSNVYRFGSNGFYLGAVAGSYLSFVFEGPLRFALQSASASTLIYVRDLVAVVAVVLACGSWVAGQAAAVPVAAVLAVLLSHTVVGLLTLPTAFQALFGFKIYLTFLLGFIVAPILARHQKELIAFSAFVFVSSAVGVAINYYVDFPWIGADFESAFGTASSGMKWYTQSGVVRLPGFSRASFSVASIMLVAFVPILASNANFFIKLVLLGAASQVIALTTSKGALLALVAVTVDAILAYGIRARAVGNTLLIALAFVCLGVPILSLNIGNGTGAAPEWFGSFMERILEMWPRAFALWEHPMQALWGRGLGGIGTAQGFGEELTLNAGDNLMVYLLVSCGMLGIAYVVFFLLKLILYSHRLPSTDILFRCTRGWTILWLTYGLTANMIEEANVNLVIGIVFGLVFGLLYPERRGSAHPAAYGRHSERAVRGRITSSRSPSNQPGAS